MHRAAGQAVGHGGARSERGVVPRKNALVNSPFRNNGAGVIQKIAAQAHHRVLQTRSASVQQTAHHGNGFFGNRAVKATHVSAREIPRLECFLRAFGQKALVVHQEHGRFHLVGNRRERKRVGIRLHALRNQAHVAPQVVLLSVAEDVQLRVKDAVAPQTQRHAPRGCLHFARHFFG